MNILRQPTTFAIALLFAATLAMLAHDTPTLTTGVLLAIPLIWLSAIDVQTYTIPDALNLWVAGLGMSIILITGQPIWGAIVTALITYAVIWALTTAYRYLRGVDGLGLGDAKLLAAGAFWVGLEGIPSVVFLGAMSGIITVLALRVITGRDLNARLPFGPFLAYALFWVWLRGPLF